MLDLASSCLLVKAFWVAALRHSQRRVDEALREVVGVADELAHAPTHGPCRRDETRQHDDAGVGQDARQVGHAPHILRAVLVGEAQVRVEAVAEIAARGPNA